MEELLCAEELVDSPWSDLKDEAACSNAESEGHYSLGFLEFPIHDDTTLASLLEREQELCPKTGYFSALQSEDICAARSNAVQWMLKVRSVYNFSPLTAILAVNYFDRYLSIHLAKCLLEGIDDSTAFHCLCIYCGKNGRNVSLRLHIAGMLLGRIKNIVPEFSLLQAFSSRFEQESELGLTMAHNRVIQ